MKKFTGMDVHATSCTIAIMSATGKRLSWEVVETNGAALVEAVKKIRGAVYLCMEEGTQSAWLCEILWLSCPTSGEVRRVKRPDGLCLA